MIPETVCYYCNAPVLHREIGYPARCGRRGCPAFSEAVHGPARAIGELNEPNAFTLAGCKLDSGPTVFKCFVCSSPVVNRGRNAVQEIDPRGIKHGVCRVCYESGRLSPFATIGLVRDHDMVISWADLEAANKAILEGAA